MQRSAVRDAMNGVPSEDFFRYPRAVFAVVADVASTPEAPLSKDRLYLGYQETAAVVEVISYNETAGRFEFQVVKGYRAGGKPEVVYANRTVCVACHQNHAPLFSRQVWDETNANPALAQRLLAAGHVGAATRALNLHAGQLARDVGCGGGWSDQPCLSAGHASAAR